MKKTLIALFVAVALLCLGACGVPGEQPVETGTSQTGAVSSVTTASEQTVQTTDATVTEASETESTSLPTFTAESESQPQVTTADTELQVPVVEEDPISVLSDMCNEYAELSIAYSTIGEGDVGTYLLSAGDLLMYANNFFDESEWTVLPYLPDLPELMPRLFTVTVASPDGAETVAVKYFRGLTKVEYVSGETVQCWESEGEAEFGSFAKLMRRAFYQAETDQLDYVIDGSYSPEAACELFVKEVYPEAKQSLCKGNHNGFDGFELISWEFNGQNAEGTAFAGAMRYAFVPKDWESPYMMAGNTMVGTDEYEHMLVESKGFQMSLGVDGCWHLDSMGTGNYSFE